MTDSEILTLYQTRAESAIEETQSRYGAYCFAIAMNILQNRQDAEECVNDTFLNAWNVIPPQEPRSFSSFLGRITRNLSLDKYKSRKAEKRGGNDTDLLLSELEDCVSSDFNVEDRVEEKDLSREIDAFLKSVKEEDAAYFLCRYWYGDTVPTIAEKFSVGQSKVKMSLLRTRKKLKAYLEPD